LWFYSYSVVQLERIAEDKLREFDSERLVAPKNIDVYDFIEACLDVPYDWKNLTPNQSILGVTAFSDGYWWVWDGAEGDLPRKHPVTKGTILIDNSLVAPDAVKGRENFTVIHECFHQILHERVFRQRALRDRSYSRAQDISAVIGKTRPQLTGMEITEWQANAATAAFLMPRRAVVFAFREAMKIPASLAFPVKYSLAIETQIEVMADMFGVSYTAMKYRLFDLCLVEGSISVDVLVSC